jgi:phospholipid/cholesterol/gamma-HCH transport system permease protein
MATDAVGHDGGGRRSSDAPPPSARLVVAPPRPPSWVEEQADKILTFLEHLGQLGRMIAKSFAAMWKRPFEIEATMHQMMALGVASVSIASVTAVFTGMVMAVQFAIGLQKFGGMEYTGRVIGISFSRELAPTLTAVIVGGRIGAGIAAEIGSMSVTEQIDAIRSLGADPIKKLVVPRLVACVIVMPVLGVFALILGFGGAMAICAAQFNIPVQFFLQTALESCGFRDFLSGIYKTPFFGAIIAWAGCHFGLLTRGGTEGVGQATTRTVVATSIAILIADFFLTKLSILLFPG